MEQTGGMYKLWPVMADTADTDYWDVVRDEVGYANYNGSQRARDNVVVNIRTRMRTVAALQEVRDLREQVAIANQVAAVRRIVAEMKEESVA